MKNNKTLYALAKNNKIQMWEAEINPNLTKEGYVEIIATYGFTDGKKTTKSTYVKSGKNIGKKNETTIYEQAELKLKQMYDARIKDNSMVYDIKDYVKPKRPALANTYKKRIKHLTHIKEWLVDVKLNGNRTYRNSDSTYISKSGDDVTPINYIEEEFKKLIKFIYDSGVGIAYDIEFDGEYYKHGIDLQQITGYVNTISQKDRDEKSDLKLEFHIFDIYFNSNHDNNFNNSSTAITRYNFLKEWFDKYEEINGKFNYLKLVEKIIVKNCPEKIDFYTRLYESQGYEGTILRNPHAKYSHSVKISDRTDDLLKDKNFKDSEFLILDIIKNENEDSAKFIIQLPNGNTNETVLEGDKLASYKYFLEKEKYIGGYLKVQYQAYTKYGKLEFPVGLEVRIGKMTEDGFDSKY